MDRVLGASSGQPGIVRLCTHVYHIAGSDILQVVNRGPGSSMVQFRAVTGTPLICRSACGERYGGIRRAAEQHRPVRMCASSAGLSSGYLSPLRGVRLVAEVRVESVAGASGGQPGTVGLAGGRAVAARRAIVVATDAPAARALLGNALEASPSKTEPGVGTCNVYFRCAVCRCLSVSKGSIETEGIGELRVVA